MKKILMTSALAALALMPASAQKVNKSSGGLPYYSGSFHICKSMEQYVLGTAYRDLSQGNHPAGFQQVRDRGQIQEL